MNSLLITKFLGTSPQKTFYCICDIWQRCKLVILCEALCPPPFSFSVSNSAISQFYENGRNSYFPVNILHDGLINIFHYPHIRNTVYFTSNFINTTKMQIFWYQIIKSGKINWSYGDLTNVHVFLSENNFFA